MPRQSTHSKRDTMTIDAPHSVDVEDDAFRVPRLTDAITAPTAYFRSVAMGSLTPTPVAFVGFGLITWLRQATNLWFMEPMNVHWMTVLVMSGFLTLLLTPLLAFGYVVPVWFAAYVTGHRVPMMDMVRTLGLGAVWPGVFALGAHTALGFIIAEPARAPDAAFGFAGLIGLVTGLWLLALWVIGVREQTRVTTVMAAVYVLWPLLATLLFIAVVFAVSL